MCIAIYHSLKLYEVNARCRDTQGEKGIIIFGKLWGISDFLHLDTLNSKQVCKKRDKKNDIHCGG